MSISAKTYFLRVLLCSAAAAALLSVGACGGGSSGGGNGTSGDGGGSGSTGGGDSGGTGSGPTPPPATGTVAILFTDGPTDEFCQIRATIESIELLNSSGTRANVFTGPATVDVLDLRNYTDFFAVDPEVPVGSYEKLRMTLATPDGLALVRCDAGGNPEPEFSWEHPQLPGNGKLDFQPRGTFEVVGGETMVVELDMDMEKSLHLHQTGSGKWMFRPVVFVTIHPERVKLVRVFGEARNPDGTTFELCPLYPVSAIGGGDPNVSPECLDVFTDADTGIFDESGTRVGLSSVASGDLLTAIGFLRVYDDSDPDNRMDDLRLDAAVIELGERGTFDRLTGAVVSAPGNNDLFVFDPTPLDDTTNAIDVLLQSGTHIFALGGNAELTAAALQPGTTGEVDGVFATPPAGEPLRSSLIVLDADTTPQVQLLDAVIQSPIPADDDAVPETRRFLVDTLTLNDKCVKTDVGTRYLRITETADTSETAEISFADLAAGDTVDVYGAGDATEPACVLAGTIQSYGAPGP